MAKLFRILSIDGGGIRGIIPAQVLVVLEKLLEEVPEPKKKKPSQSKTEKKASAPTEDKPARIGNFFDLIAGTSTGGILTRIYLCPSPKSMEPRFSVSDAVDLYSENGDEIFDVPLSHKIRSAAGLLDEKHPSDGLEDVLNHYFSDLRLSGLLKPCLIAAYDIRRRRAMFFTQHDAAQDSKDLCINVELTPSRLRPGMTPEMDDASTENINGLRELGAELAQEKEEELKAFARLLIQ